MASTIFTWTTETSQFPTNPTNGYDENLSTYAEDTDPATNEPQQYHENATNYPGGYTITHARVVVKQEAGSEWYSTVEMLNGQEETSVFPLNEVQTAGGIELLVLNLDSADWGGAGFPDLDANTTNMLWSGYNDTGNDSVRLYEMYLEVGDGPLPSLFESASLTGTATITAGAGVAFNVSASLTGIANFNPITATTGIIAENITIADSNVRGFSAYFEVESEGLGVSDVDETLKFALPVLSDTIEMDHGAIVLSQITQIFENVTLSDVLLSGGIFYDLISENATLRDIVQVAIFGSVNEDLTLADELSILSIIGMTIADSISLDDAVVLLGNYSSTILDNLVLNDSVIGAFIELLAETINASDTLSSMLEMNNILAEDITVDDTLSDSIRIAALLEDGITLSDTQMLNALLTGTIEDGIKFFIEGNIADEDFSGWVINPEGFSTYNYDFEFKHSAIFGDKYLFANTNGLYELGGTTDAGTDITSAITTAALSFGTSNIKQVPQIYFGTNASKMYVEVRVDDQDTGRYELIETTGGDLNTKHIKIGKGLKGRYWQFRVVDSKDPSFDLDSIEFMPVAFKRKY